MEYLPCSSILKAATHEPSGRPVETGCQKPVPEMTYCVEWNVELYGTHRWFLYLHIISSQLSPVQSQSVCSGGVLAADGVLRTRAYSRLARLTRGNSVVT